MRIGSNYPGAIHLLVADAVMPGMSGGEVAQQLLAERPGMKVLFMSGYPGDAITHRGVLTATSPLLAKPFTTEDLSRRVREMLDISAGVDVISLPGNR